MINCRVCTSVASSFKTSGCKGHFDHMRETKPLCNDCLVTRIKKRQTIVENKNEFAKRNKLRDFEMLTFFL